MQYGAGAKSIVNAVRSRTGDHSIPDEQGQIWYDQFKSTYKIYATFVDFYVECYMNENMVLQLPDGWRIGPNNPSPLSVGNFGSQGLGASILRLACQLIDEAGYTILATMHDDICVECGLEEREYVASRVAELMAEASRRIMGSTALRVGLPEYVLPGELWFHGGGKKDWDKYKEWVE